MLRVLSSWRLLALALVLAFVVLAGLAQSFERQQGERTLHALVAEAELVAELLLEVNLAAEDPQATGLPPEVLARVSAGVEHLKAEGRLIGLQLWGGDSRLLYSDDQEPDDLSDEEQAEIRDVLAGEPAVEFEHDEGRERASATVLIQPENNADRPSGLVAELLLPEDEVSAALAAARQRMYGGAGVLLALLAGLALRARTRMLAREHEALHDPLTGLGNRALLAKAGSDLAGDRRRRADEHGLTALLLLDLDGFKNVNDTLGHAVGDRLLVEVAATLRQSVRSADVVTRLGGDEFAILLRDLPDADSALRAAATISAALHRPYAVDQVTLEVGVSVGVAVTGEHGQELESLLRRADVAMYQAKREGGGARLYDEASDPHDQEQLGLLSQLRTAIETDQLRLHFQPKVSLREGRTVGFEALVRWEHPERGLLLPGTFVPVAERTALLRPLTAWVLRAAIAECAGWRVQGWDADVAVNIAPATLLEPEFPAQVMQLLAEAGLPGHALELEITETAVMVDPGRAAETLRLLQAMGVSVSIDDFGAGYTSLSYLKSLPVSTLKIDRGFVTNLLDNREDEAVARSVVTLGHDLGLTVVAEGVETADVRQRLLELGCDEIQGYLLARPMPGTEIDGWLREQRADARTGVPAVDA